MSDDSATDSFDEGASSDFAPVKPAKTTKAKAAPKKAAAGPAKPRGRPAKDPSAPPKPRAKAAPKKKAAIASDDENSDDDMPDAVNDYDDESMLADTPPQKKKAPAPKKKAAAAASKQPLADIANESFDMTESMIEVPVEDGDAADGSKYQKLTLKEHIMKRPDTYIGSVERTEGNMWVYNTETEAMEYRKVSYVPGLYKIFDEILVNAADNKQNDKNMSESRVTIDRASGEISVRKHTYTPAGTQAACHVPTRIVVLDPR